MLEIHKGIRFFDDNPGIHGHYFDGFHVPVENMSELVRKPVTHLLILSFQFGEKIRENINKIIPEHNMMIRCFTDFY
jgi:hypothetical protein